MHVSSVSTRLAYAVILVGALGHACLTFVWFSLPAYLSVIIDEVGLTSTQAGVLAGAVPLTYIPLALLTGLAIDRIGPGHGLTIGALVFGLAQIGRSTATGFVPLFIFTVMVGVGATAVTFGLPKLVSYLFPPRRAGLPSSIYVVGGPLGSASIFAVGRPVLGPGLGGWRPLFFWSGIVVVGYALCWFIIARLADINEYGTEESSFSIDSIKDDLGFVLPHRNLQLVVVVATMYLFVNHGIQGWLPTILETRGFSPGLAGQTTGLFVATFAIGVFVIPAGADWFHVRQMAVIACGGAILLGAAGLLLDTPGQVVFVGVGLAGIGAGGIAPLIRAIPPELDGIGAGRTGTAVGFTFAVGEIGGFVGPVSVGLLHEHTMSFLPGIVLLGLAGLVVSFAGETMRRRHG